MNNPKALWHDRVATALRDNRSVITAELSVATIIQACGVLSTALIPLFIVGWLSLWLRQSGWRQVGLVRPASWGRIIGLGVLVGGGVEILSIWLVNPLFDKLANKPETLRQFDPLHGNILGLLFWLLLVWTVVAFGEEMVYRGYLLNRFADLAGHNRAGWAVGLIGSSAFFGLGHAYQGLTGMFEAFLMGCVLGGLYFVASRNLWLPIIAHGSYNTVGFVLLFLGLFP